MSADDYDDYAGGHSHPPSVLKRIGTILMVITLIVLSPYLLAHEFIWRYRHRRRQLKWDQNRPFKQFAPPTMLPRTQPGRQRKPTWAHDFVEPERPMRTRNFVCTEHHD